MNRAIPHFSNGIEYMGWQDSHCFDCLNFRSVDNKIPLCKCKDNDGEGGFGCAITDMFELYQDEMSDGMKRTLLPDYDCPMRLTAKDARLRLSEYYKRVELENNQLKQGLIQGNLLGGEL